MQVRARYAQQVVGVAPNSKWSRQMTAPTTTDLPAGADPENSDYWDTSDAVAYRLIWSRPQPLPDELARENVRAVVVQYADGRIATDGDDAPLVYCGGSDYSVTTARALGNALLAAADLADEW